VADSKRTSSQIIVEEIRRQVDLQISAHDALDTKAMAIFSGIAAIAAFVAPRVAIDNPYRIVATGATFGLLLGALACLLLAVRPRIGGFSNGPKVDQIGERIGQDPASLEADLVPAFVKVRNQNEKVLASKGEATVFGLRLVFGAVVGVGAMVVVGAVK